MSDENTNSNVANLPWLGRKTRAENFASIIESNTEAKVISIEAGFGFGKSIFAAKWAELLRERGESVIEFDAWQADHSDDPLLAFTSKLLESMPPKPEGAIPDDSKREKALRAFGSVAKVVGIAGAKAAAGSYGADAAAKFFEIDDDTDEKALIEEVSKATAGETSKLFANLLGAQMTADRLRNTDLPNQLAALRGELDKNDKGRIIVIIDELDRCRPDFAISMLEAIKHLFHQPGFVFVLMINPEQIERTASRLFGAIEEGEPYFAKFVDLRLSLGMPDYGELAEHLCKPLEGKFTPLTDSPDMQFPLAASWFAKFAKRMSATPRQMEIAVRHAFVSFALANGQAVDPAYLLCASFVRLTHASFKDRSSELSDSLPWIKVGSKIEERLDELKRRAKSGPMLENDSIILSGVWKLNEEIETEISPLQGRPLGNTSNFHDGRVVYNALVEACELAGLYSSFFLQLVEAASDIQVTEPR